MRLPWLINGTFLFIILAAAHLVLPEYYYMSLGMSNEYFLFSSNRINFDGWKPFSTAKGMSRNRCVRLLLTEDAEMQTRRPGSSSGRVNG